MSLNSTLEPEQDINNNHWSNKFGVKDNPLIKAKLNKKLKALIEHDKWGYKDKTKQTIEALINTKLCEYQYQLLKAYFKSPVENLHLDCDMLTITFKCQQSDIDKLLGVGNCKGIEKFSINSLNEVITIQAISIDNINSGGKGAHRPYYVKAFRFNIFKDKRKYLRFYIADGTGIGKTKKDGYEPLLGIRIDFIPNRFSDIELRMLFGHFQSVLNHSRYKQFYSQARITRVDVAFNMPGLFSPFMMVTTKKNITNCSDFPSDNMTLTETSYLGKKGKSTHCIIYDKILKEMKTDVKNGLNIDILMSLYENIAVTTRMEERFSPYKSYSKEQKNNKQLLLKNLSTANIQLNMLKVLDPRVLQHLEPKLLRKLTRNRTHSLIKDLMPKIRVQAKDKIKIKHLSLDKDWHDQAKIKLLDHYQKIIQNPVKVTREEIKKFIEQNNKSIAASKSMEVAQAQKKIKFDGKLNDAQSKAVKATERHVLVIAGAGTGKTKTIVERVKHLRDVQNISYLKIQVLAYTNEAAKELSHRINLKDMLNGSIHASTFSAWCKKILETFFSNEFGNYKILDEEIAKTEMRLLCKKHIKVEGLSEQAMSALSYSKNRLWSLRRVIEYVYPELSEELDGLRQTKRDYKKFKMANEFFDFDDLIYLLYKRLKSNETVAKNIAKQHKYLVIDEMQDSNPLQWELIKLLTNQGAHLFCVGDPAQSIYGFRGASYTELEKFDSYSKNCKTYFLKDSYRATKSITLLSNIVRHHINPAYKSINALREHGSLPLLGEFSSLNDLGVWLRRDLIVRISKLKNEKIRVLVIKNSVINNLDKILRESEKLIPFLDRKQIVIQTMHKSKGTECDTCYVIDPRFTSNWKNIKEEHIRLLYVALTRAENHLVICKAMNGNVEYKESDDIYLLDLIAKQHELYKFIDR